jgi:hypothetical protein
MKLLLISLASMILQISQTQMSQPILKDKTWYCAKYYSFETMHGIDRHNPVFKFSLSFVNPAGKNGQHFTRSTSEGSYGGTWQLKNKILTLSPDDYNNHPSVIYEVNATSDPNFMILKIPNSSDRYYMVSSN